MFRRGYLSGAVMVLRRRKSPQGHQELSFLGTMCRGNAHAEFDHLMITAFLSFLSSALAILSLYGANRLGQANTERWLPVLMWCSTLCVGEGSVSDLTMEGYFARSRLTDSGMALLTSCSGVSAASESAAVLLQETFLTSPGAVLAEAVDLGGGVVFTIGVGAAVAAMYSDVSCLWSLSNICACRGWMDS
jgi:hypothetical protein